MPKGDPGEVTLVQFSDSGQRLQKVRIPKIVKSDDEWRKQLTREAQEWDSTTAIMARFFAPEEN